MTDGAREDIGKPGSTENVEVIRFRYILRKKPIIFSEKSDVKRKESGMIPILWNLTTR